MPDFFVGDHGATITAACVHSGIAADLTPYDYVLLRFTKPDGTEFVKTATVDTPENEAKYIVEEGVIDKAGIWKVALIATSDSQVIQGRFKVSVGS